MDNLYDVCSCLSAMDSSKATERRKNAVQLEQLLGTESITEIIDSNTTRGTGSRIVTWDVVLKGVNRYIDAEIAALQLAKESQSTTTLNNRDKKKMELTSLFRLVLRSANKGSVKLSFQPLVDRIENLLTDSYTLKTFGADYSIVFLKYVLPVRAYWLKISPDKWRNLTNLFCQLFYDNEIERGVLAKIIKALITGGCLQCQVNPRRVFTFFTKVFKDIREMGDTSMIENILTSLNIFCKAVAPNSRAQLCYFGESQMNELISLWGRNTDTIKEELIEFLHLLVRVHHPNGATDPCAGAYAHNWQLWKEQVSFLHEIIVTDIDKITDRYKFISGPKVILPAYVAFAADVFKQMPVVKLVAQDFVMPSSQASQSGNHGDHAGPAKRKRLSPESKSLIEIVNDSSNTLRAIPWLQVLHHLLSKYPDSFGEAGLTTTLQVMTTLLAECKKGQLFRFLFEVLSALIKAVQNFDGLKVKVAGMMTTVWSCCVSTINSRQAEVEGYQEHGFYAMASMINSGLVSPTKEIWNLFLPTFSCPSDTADQLLTSLINTQGLTENYIPSITGAPLGKKLIGKFPLRQSLITWLLPVVDAENGSQFKTAISPLRSAEILYALTLQDPSVIMNDLDCTAVTNRSSHSSVLETTYLKSMFDHHSLKERGNCLQLPCQKKVPGQTNPQISVLLEFLLKHLSILSNNLDQQTSDFLSWFSSLLTRLLYYLWEENAGTTQLQCILKKVLGKMAGVLVSQVQKELPSSLSSNLALLGASLTWEKEANTRMFLVAEFVRSCLPGSFVDLLLDIASGKLNKRKGSNTDLTRTPLSHHPSSSNRREAASTSRTDVDLDFEMFDAAEPSHLIQSSGSGKDFCDDFLNGTEDSSVTSQDISDFLRKENLSDNGQMSVLCTEVLCRLTSYDRRQIDGAEESVIIKAEMDSDSINYRLLRLISSETYDPSQARYVHLLLTISKHFLTCAHEVSLADIKSILTAFKQTAKELMEDQQVCCRILTHLRYIIPHLCGDSDLASKEFCRDVFLKFVSDFWRLSSDSTSILKFEMAETLLDLLKYDPDCTWGHLQIPATDKQTSDFNLCKVAHHFPKLLSDGSIVLRTFVAESLKWLFVRQDSKGNVIFRDKTTQKRAFESVFELCSELLDVEQGNLSDQRWQDELHNRQSTCLQSLLTIILVSPVCEKQCLLGLCQVLAEKKIPLVPVKKMLKIICQELKFADIQSYLSCHLPYLIHNWLHENMVNSPISQFPYKLLGFDNLEQFIRSHKDLIVSELLATKLDIAEIHAVLDPIHIDVHEAFVSALPHMLTNVLPAFAANLYEDADGSGSHSSNARKEFAKATEYFTIVVSVLSEKTIKECTFEKLGDIIVKILNCLSMDKDVTKNKLHSMVYPESNPPHCSHERIQRTLDYLAQSFLTGDKNTTLITVLAKTQDGLYQVLQSLSSLLWHEHRAHEQQRMLQMYGLFVNMLLKELVGGLGGGWASVLRDVVNRLLIVLDRSHSAVSIASPSYDEEVILTALDILRALCSTALQTCPEEMSNYIHRITDTVAGLASLSEGICRSVKDFLTSVLSTSVEGFDDLSKAMKILNPLPETPGLSQLRTQMEKITGEKRSQLRVWLNNFLEACLLMSNTPSQGLAKRIHQLTSYVVHHHSEMEDLAKTPEGLLILKNSLTELLKRVTSSHPDVASASAACLGAIGPIDLQSLSFPQWPVKTSHVLAVERYTGHVYEKYCWLLHALDTCLLDKSLQVVKTAGDILKKVLATSTGALFEADYTTALKDRSFLFHYLHPFKTVNKRHSVMAPPPAPTGAKTGTFKMLVDKPELWLGSGDSLNTSHEAWIRSLTTTLLSTGAVRDEILKTIGPMCSILSQFCEESLPFLIHDILEGGDSQQIQVLFSNISSFFHYHCISSQAPPDASTAYPSCMNKQSIWTMLSVVRYLRKRISPQEKQEVPRTSWNNYFWRDINYLEVARAALYCGANFSVVLFAEIWWDIQRNCENKPTSSQGSLSSQPSDFIQESLDPLSIVSSSQGEAGPMVQELLLEAYRNIGDPDGIYGCGAGKLAQPMARVQTYLHEQQHEKALTTLDIGVSHTTPSIALLLQTVESCGADYILQWCLSELDYIRSESAASASTSLSSSAGVAGELEEFHYQAAWKLGQWDCPLPAKQVKAAPFHQSLYQAMLSLKDGHLNIAKESLDMARCDVVKGFDPHVETCKSLYPFLSDLQCLTYLQQVLDILPKLISSSCEELLSLFAECPTKVFITTQAVHFDQEKPLLHLMASVAKILASKGVKQGQALEVRALWSLAVGGRKAKQYQLAEKAIHNLKSKIISEDSIVTLEQVHLEEAKLFWARAEVDIAKNILKNLIGQLSKANTGDVSRHLFPEALCTYGNWLAETKSETPTVIIREYLEKTVALLNESGPEPPTSEYTSLEGFVSLARFADEQYQQIADHIRSPTFEDKQHLLESLRAELKECEEFKQSKYVRTMEKTLVLDQQEIKSYQEAHGRFLLQAILNYLKCLRSGDLYNLKVFRVVALWFENCKNPEVNLLIKEFIGSIKTYKFLPLYYQLAARMSSVPRDSSNFHPVLTELMETVAQDHPHHALWIIIALAHAYKDDELPVKEKAVRHPRKAASTTEDTIEEERVQAAKCMVEKLRQTSQKLADIVTNMEKLCLAYIELANWTVINKTSRNLQPLQKDLAILKIAGCDNILLPSVELKVDPTGAYKNIISPVRFGTHFRVVGGINLPKIITCVGSDGKQRTQLVKGRDDLRQDAVMQQIFTLVNELLAGDVEARKRQLKIQTYKVIPLSQKCGLLQWCDGTKPLGEYLIGPNGAHSRYRPHDWSFKACREYLGSSGNKAEDKLKAYQKVCANFKPVFRHFFLENFLEPDVWFEKRLAYTRSVATNSIVGYILGLGDRHLMNILIDLNSAEVVHIDLGIAFEQGWILPTPETVPFRLTRDIVDGMGITGVEGVFRRCCEKTMEVMKHNSESLLTVIQVLLYDPLSHWSLTPQQALAIQRKREQENLDTLDVSVASSGQVPSSGQISSSGQVPGSAERDVSSRNNDSRETQNKMAERTLLRLRQKLGGQEDGVPLSVTGQVNLLIQKASDPENLSMLYVGWQPYL